MRTQCPKCGAKYDIREAKILEASAAIVAKRRRKAGNELSSEQARKLQELSAASRRAKRATHENAQV